MKSDDLPSSERDSDNDLDMEDAANLSQKPLAQKIKATDSQCSITPLTRVSLFLPHH